MSDNKKLNIFLIAVVAFSTTALGYGHYLAEEKILKFFCVFIWALANCLSILFVLDNYEQD